MKILMIILMFLFLGIFLIIGNYDISLYSSNDITKFSEVFASWTNNLRLNSQTLLSEIAKLSWMPE